MPTVLSHELSHQLAEIGVMLLMFGVGLHFSLDELLAVRRIALPGAIVQIAGATLLGTAVAAMWGWSLAGSIVFGLGLSVASAVVLLRALENRGILETVNGRIAVGWLVVEDLVMVLVLVLMPPLSTWLGGNAQVHAAGAGERGLLTTLALTLGQVTVFIALMLVVGRRVFPGCYGELPVQVRASCLAYASSPPSSVSPTARPHCLASPSLSAFFLPAWSCASRR